jgi:hypothetical protein
VLLSALRCENMRYQRPRIRRAVLGQSSLANGRQFAPLKEAMDIGTDRRRTPIACTQPARVGLGSTGFPGRRTEIRIVSTLIAKRDEIERSIANYEVRLDGWEKTLN